MSYLKFLLFRKGRVGVILLNPFDCPTGTTGVKNLQNVVVFSCSFLSKMPPPRKCPPPTGKMPQPFFRLQQATFSLLSCSKVPFAFRDASVFTKKASNRIGRVYKKTVYREYTDGKFSTQKPRRKDLGILGPVIRGEFGDVISIHFKVDLFIRT